nr:MAG TPA: hypothetical protein [Caudoviricetes sp.]
MLVHPSGEVKWDNSNRSQSPPIHHPFGVGLIQLER